MLLFPLQLNKVLSNSSLKTWKKKVTVFKIRKKFTTISDAKIKEIIFVGPQFRFLMKDKEFQATIIVTELEAWLMFTNVHNFFSNLKHPNYKNIVATLLDKYQ